MAVTGCSVLSRSGTPSTSSWLRFWRRRPAVKPSPSLAPRPEDPLLAAGRELRQSREARGLSLRQLAQRTRISAAVLEALERGWRDRLPEAAYLRTMFPLLEAELELPSGRLSAALPREKRRRSSRLRQQRLSPGSIDVFNSWQGVVLYAVLTLGLIYALNLEQQRLAAQGLLALRPIPPLPPSEQAKPQPPGASLLQAYPELRPLDQAAQGQGLRLLSRDIEQADRFSPGILELRLTASSRVSLRTEAGPSSSLDAVQGQLRLPLTSPFLLRIVPAPATAAQVSWNGQPLAPLPGRPGQFALPAPALAPPAPAAPAPRPEARTSSP